MKHAGAVALSILIFILAACTPPPKPTPKPQSANLPDISNYTAWYLVTQQVVTSALCVPSPIVEGFKSNHPSTTKASKHDQAYIKIYVNKVGQDAILGQKLPVFPDDSTIVKAKYDSPDTNNLQFHTVMRKLPKGTSPKTGDWQYLFYMADAKSQFENHGLGDCQKCHAQWEKTDYVSRDYLTVEQISQLK